MIQPGGMNLEALPSAQEALKQLDVPIEVDARGDVEGVAAAAISLDALAAALAALFEFPLAKGSKAPGIVDVLAYLVAIGRAKDATLAKGRELVAELTRSRYEPLEEDDVEHVEGLRRHLYDAIGEQLRAVEEAPPDG